MKLLTAMLLTAVIETVFFCCLGYRKGKLLAYVFIINLLTNLLVNLAFQAWYADFPWHHRILATVLEICVVGSEFYLIGLYDKRWTAKLLRLVFLANLLSYGTGIVLQFLGFL